MGKGPHPKDAAQVCLAIALAGGRVESGVERGGC